MLIGRYYNINGCKEIEIMHVYPEDADWFNKHGIVISMEADSTNPNNVICYGKWGMEDDEESIQLSMGRSCEDTLHALKESIIEMMKNYGKTFDTIR